MGFWSKTSTITTTKTACKAKKLHEKSKKYINQRICPLEQDEQQERKHQEQKHQQQHPPTQTQSHMDQPRIRIFCAANQPNGKQKSQQKSQNHDKYLTATICHCTNEREGKRSEKQLELPERKQQNPQPNPNPHQNQKPNAKPKQRNFATPNEVNGSSHRATLQLTLKSAVPTTSRNHFPRGLCRCWICVPILLTALLTTIPAVAAAATAATAAAASATKGAATIGTTVALITLATTIASVTVSVSGAAAPYPYSSNGGIKYVKKSLEQTANEAENIHQNDRAEPVEELMYAYYKRAQHQQQRHLHQRATAAPETAPAAESFSVSFNSEEFAPTMDIISMLAPKQEFASRTQKRSDKLTENTSKSSTLTLPPLALPTASSGPSSPSPSSLSSSSSPSLSSSSSTAAPTNDKPPASMPEDEKCEPKVLDEVPAEPFYDFSDVAEDAARQFSEFLGSKFPESPPQSKHNITEKLRLEITRRAYGIASYALNEDDNLLAFAIAAPSVHTVVLKFRSNVTVPPEQAQNKSFLGSYWRELIYAWNSTEEQEWGAPFRDCNLLKKRWLWPFRISYTENKFKIVAAAFIAADEDVCNDGLEEVFGRRHGCDRNTTFCLVTESKPLPTRDAYTCICRESFYLPNSTLQGFRGDIVEMSEGYDNYSCIPCPDGCTICDQNGECLILGEPVEVVSMESLMKVSVGSVLGACLLCCIVLSVIVFRQRKTKAIAIGMWTVLETILLGIILLYSSVTVHFFPASTLRCLIEPWLRELGFVIFYGAIILKLYRHLVDFRTRKAHRWVLRDVDLLKYLATMVFAVLCYLAGFTASSYDLLKTGQLESLREISTNTCIPLKWEYVTQFSEIFIICFGLHLSFASRNANTQFRERQFLVATLMLEFIVSTTFYILRFTYLPEMSPSTIFLALFVRSQLTNTISLGLIFVPKLWYQHKQVRSLAHDLSIRLPVDAFKGSHDVGQRLGGGYAGLCLGDPDIGELTISEMSPEDIRAELKRLYTQLEVLKNKTLRQDNPHISKRRGGRKAGHRRFSLQALSAKHRSNKHHQDIEITEAEPSRTPEDSVCSVEGPTDIEISGISQSMLSHSMISHSAVSQSK